MKRVKEDIELDDSELHRRMEEESYKKSMMKSWNITNLKKNEG